MLNIIEHMNNCIPAKATIQDAISTIEKNDAKIALVINSDNHLLGTITDGDIRRGFLRGVTINDAAVHIMNNNPKTATQDDDEKALNSYMIRKHLRQIPIIDNVEKLVGIYTININDKEYDNWVILMAGGKGKRLRPLTNDIPKPMLKIGSKPMLEIIIDGFVNSGFKKFLISVNYKAELIQQYFGNGTRKNIEIEYLYEDKPLDTAGILSDLKNKPEQAFFVMNGDILSNISYEKILDFHREQKSKATMCIRDYHFTVPYGIVSVENSQMKGVDEKPEHRYFVNAGIYVFEPEVISLVPEHESYTMPQLFNKMLDKDMPCAVFPISEYWLDIGRLDDFERANNDISSIFK